MGGSLGTHGTAQEGRGAVVSGWPWPYPSARQVRTYRERRVRELTGRASAVLNVMDRLEYFGALDPTQRAEKCREIAEACVDATIALTRSR